MVAVKQRALRLGFAGAAALAISIVPTALISHAFAGPSNETVSQPCYNGIVPGNPYVDVCGLPPSTGHVRGAAPGAGAIIACKNIPGCLSCYVNGC
jgi:hypothetical protein